MANAHDVNLYGYLQKDGTDLYGPLTQARLNATVNSMLAWRDSNRRDDFSIDQEGMYADILANAGDNYSPGIGGVEQVSMLDKIDGANYWTVRGYPNHIIYWIGAFGLGSDLGIQAGGYNSGSGRIGVCDRYQNSVDTWLVRTSLNYLRNSPGGAQLDTYRGLIFGGANGDAIGGMNQTERFDNTDNTWTNRGSLNTRRGYNNGFELTNDLCISCGGYNLSGGVRNECERYSDSANTWSNRTACANRREAGACSSFTSDMGSLFGGNNGSGSFTDFNELYSNAANTWTAKSTLHNTRTEGQGADQSSDTGFALGGYDQSIATYLSSIERFSISANEWTYRTNAPGRLYNGGAWNASSTKVLTSHNRIDFYNTMTFKDTPVTLSMDGGLSTETYKHQTPAVPYDPDTYQRVILTGDVTDTTTQIKSLVVSALYNQRDAVEMAGYWTLRNPSLPEKEAPGSFSLGTDGGISAGGRRPTGRITTTTKFSDSQNVWNSKSSFSLARSHIGGGIELTSDRGLIVGGNNGSSPYYVNNVDRFSNSANNWSSRTVYPDAIQHPAQFNLTTDLGMAAGGINGVSYVAVDNARRHSDSGNSWTTRTTLNQRMGYNSGFKLTDDKGISFVGYRESPSTLLTNQTELYSDSENSWTIKSKCPFAVYGAYGFELDTNLGLVGGGYSTSLKYLNYAYEFNAVKNTYTSKTEPSIVSTNLTGNFGLGTSTGCISTGESSTSNYNYDNYRFTNSEPMSISFPTFDLTLDGDDNDEHTFPVRDQELNTIVNLEDYYSTSKEYWTMRSGMIYDQQGMAFFALESTRALSSSGRNDTGGAIDFNTQRFDDTENVWIARTSTAAGSQKPASFALTSDIGLIATGNNGGGNFVLSSSTFTDSTNAFATRTNPNTACEARGIEQTSNLGFKANWYNGVDIKTSEQYNYSGNSWTNKSSQTELHSNCIAFGLDSDLGMMCGGYNGGSSFAKSCERYSDADNAWTFRANLPGSSTSYSGGYFGNGFNTSSVSGLGCGGYNGPGNECDHTAREYNDTTNNWTSKPDYSSVEYVNQPGTSTLTNPNGLLFGGQNGGGSLVTTSTRKYVSESVSAIPAPSGVWTQRTTNFADANGQTGFGLTTDRAIIAGGQNGGVTDDVGRYSNSADVWVSRAVLTDPRGSFGGFKLTENIGITCGGQNNSRATTVERYDDSKNTWSTRTGLTIGRNGCCGLELDSDMGICACGYNGSGNGWVDRYSNAANSWTSKTQATIFKHEAAGVGLTSDRAILYAGTDPNYKSSVTEKYSESADIWYFGVSSVDPSERAHGFSLGTDVCIKAGGSRSAPFSSYSNTVQSHTDSSNVWKTLPSINQRAGHGSAEFGSHMGLISGGYNGTGYPSGAERYQDAESPVLTETGYWTSRVSMAVPRSVAAGFDLTSNLGVIAGGYNVSAKLGTTERYSDTDNSWTSRTSFTEVRNNLGGFGLDSDLGIACGGNNNSNRTSAVDRYSDTGNSWTGRTSLSAVKQNNPAFGLTSDLGMVGGGESGGALNTTERYSDSGNSWTGRTNLNVARYASSAIQLDSDKGIISNGFNTTFLTTTDRYSDSGNSWTLRADQITRNGWTGAFEISSTTGLVAGGGNSYSSTTPEKYNDTDNTWSLKFSLNTIRTDTMGFSSSDGIIAGGNNGTRIGTTERYIDSVETPIVYGSVWTMRTTLGHARNTTAGCPLDTNEGIICGGYNGSNTIDDTDLFNDVDNTWTSKTAMNSARQKHACFGLTTNLAMAATGAYTQVSTERFSKSGDSWTARSSVSNGRELIPGCGLTSDKGVIAGGHDNDPGVNLPTGLTETYSDTGNSWTIRTSLTARASMGAFSLGDSDKGIFTGGMERPAGSWVWATTTERFSESGNSWTSRNGFNMEGNSSPTGSSLSASYGLAIGGQSPTGVRFDYTQKFSDTNNIWSTEKPITVGRSRGGAFYLGSDDKAVFAGGYTGSAAPQRTGMTERYTDVATAEAFVPRYKMRLKFNLPRDISNVWSLRGNMTAVRGYHMGAELTNDVSMVACGDYNLAPGYTNTVERYINSSNSWSSRTTHVQAKQTDGFGLTTDSAMVACGYNNSYLTNCHKYSDSANLWTTRTSQSYGVNHNPGFELTTNLAVTATGMRSGGATKYCYTYNDSANTWTETTSTDLRRNAAAFSISADSGMVTTGNNDSAAVYSNKLFSHSAGSWTSKVNGVESRNLQSAGNLSGTTNGLAVSGRLYGGTYRDTVEKYYPAGDIWTRTSSFILGANGGTIGTETVGIAGGAFVSGGNDGTGLFNSSVKFINQETSFSGFAVQTFS